MTKWSFAKIYTNISNWKVCFFSLTLLNYYLLYFYTYSYFLNKNSAKQVANQLQHLLVRSEIMTLKLRWYGISRAMTDWAKIYATSYHEIDAWRSYKEKIHIYLLSMSRTFAWRLPSSLRKCANVNAAW